VDKEMFKQTVEHSFSKGGAWSVMYAILNFWRIRLRDSEIAKMAYNIWKNDGGTDERFYTLWDSLNAQFKLRDK